MTAQELIQEANRLSAELKAARSRLNADRNRGIGDGYKFRGDETVIELHFGSGFLIHLTEDGTLSCTNSFDWTPADPTIEAMQIFLARLDVEVLAQNV